MTKKMYKENIKILVLGNFGCLGHVVEQYFKRQTTHTLLGLNRKHFNAEDPLTLLPFITKFQPDYIINCVGVLMNCKDISRYSKVNVFFPKYLDFISEEFKFKLIHISTNCVFKGLGPHTIGDKPDAVDLYGVSKAFGEIDNDRNLTIRTSIIGPEIKENPQGLMQWFLNNNDKNITGYANAFWNGVTTLQLTKFIEECLNNETGIVNYHTADPISKLKLLKLINMIYYLDKNIISTYKEGVHSSLLTGTYTTNNYETQIRELKGWYKQ